MVYCFICFFITREPFIEHHHKGHDHVHDSSVSSVSIVSEGTLDLDYVRVPLPSLMLVIVGSRFQVHMFLLLLWLVTQFDDWLERLVEEKGDDLYRMKGILSVSDSEQRYVFQVIPQ